VIVGVPKDIKAQGYRVGIAAGGIKSLVQIGQQVLVEKGAGEGSGYRDAEYQAAGADIVNSAAEVYERADMIVKVKEPQPPEYEMLRRGQILFCYLHLAAEPELTGSRTAHQHSGFDQRHAEIYPYDHGRGSGTLA
jgi:alanine dehydrogenase